MEKSKNHAHSPLGKWRKLVLIMKLKLFILLCCLQGVHANVLSQQRYDVSFQEETVLSVIDYLRQHTGYEFFYLESNLQSAGLVTVDMKQATLSEILDAVLKGQNLTYEIHEKPQKSVTVRGFVYDEKKLPLPGVTVQVVGTTVGTATTANGWFSIVLPMLKGKLKFTFVGYKDKEIEFSEKTENDTLRITMEENVEQLDEAIVVAYGETTRRKTTGSISVVKADERRGIPSTSIATMLQGRVAGMDVTQMSGSPGGGGTAVIIRGYNSLDVEQGRRFSDPLWVVDGVPMNAFTSPISGTNLLSDLNPDMIESVQILKDASAASIYGSRAANGVILVTTKKGKRNQKATFSVNFSQTWSILPKLPTVTIGREERRFRLEVAKWQQYAYLDPETNRYKYPESLREQYENNVYSSVYDKNFIPVPNNQNSGTTLQDSLNSFYNNATNFFPIYYVKGKVTNANIQTYGGGENMTYGLGLGYYKEDGIFRGTGYNRVDLNSSMYVTPVKNLSVDMRFNVSLANRNRATKSDMLGGTAPSVEVVPGEPYGLSSLLPGEGSVPWNTVLDAYKGTKEKNRNIRLRSNFKLEYMPIKGLSISASLAADYSIDRRNYFQPSYLSDAGYSKSIGETGVNLMVLNEDIVSYNRMFNDVHSLSVVAGFSYQYDQTEYNGGSAENSPSDKIYYAPSGLPDLGWKETSSGVSDYEEPIAFQHYQSDMNEKNLLSYFARAEYGYKDKYMLSLSFRRDGSSTFGADNRWGTFPSVAAAWTFSEEKWVKENLGWLSFGKFRASWGRSGMHFSECYLALGELYVGGSIHGESTLYPLFDGGMYNPDLTWEETDQYDFGLDLDFFDYRLTVTADYYYRYTDKMLGKLALQGSHNAYTSQWSNAMAISNEGVELMVKYDIFRKDDLYWKISVNGARNWNRFEKSYNGRDYGGRIIGKSLNGLYVFLSDGYVDSYDELKLYYNAAGMGFYASPSEYQRGRQLKPGDINYMDVDGDGVVGMNDQVYFGSALPEVSGGIVNELRWKNIDLNMLMTYSLGRRAVNGVERSSLYSDGPVIGNIYDYTFWEKAGDNPDYPAIGRKVWAACDKDVEKTNFLRLKSLTVGYSLPRQWIRSLRMTELRLFVSGENLFIWDNYSGMDPETIDITSGFDSQQNYPLPRKLTLGITLKF